MLVYLYVITSTWTFQHNLIDDFCIASEEVFFPIDLLVSWPVVHHRKLHLQHADTSSMWQNFKDISDINICKFLSLQPEAGIHQVFLRPEHPTWERSDRDLFSPNVKGLWKYLSIISTNYVCLIMLLKHYNPDSSHCKRYTLYSILYTNSTTNTKLMGVVSNANWLMFSEFWSVPTTLYACLMLLRHYKPDLYTPDSSQYNER